jgi:hypothetical protein
MAPWLVQNLTVHRVAGHDELPEGSNDPDKRCPGAYLSRRDLRRDVALGMERQAMARLMAGSGVVL